MNISRVMSVLILMIYT